MDVAPAKNPNRDYGVCPTQLQGRTLDGRPFYFRARSGAWTLRVGAITDPLDYVRRAGHGDEIATGEDATGGCMKPDVVDGIVDTHLGAGWTSPYDDPDVVSA